MLRLIAGLLTARRVCACIGRNETFGPTLLRKSGFEDGKVLFDLGIGNRLEPIY